MVVNNKSRKLSELNILTEMKEDYIRAIYVLKHRNQKDPVVNEIANYLNQKKSTVSEALKALHEQGFVLKKRYKPIHLTNKGIIYAKKLTWKHRLLELFLYRILDIPVEDIHQEAHKLEHSTSDIIAQAMFNFISNPENSLKKLEVLKNVDVLTCPHGQPLPNIDELS